MTIIEKRMSEKGIGKGQLMDLLGVKAAATITRYMKDPLRMSGYQIKAVCNLLDIDVKDFFRSEV